MQVVELDKNLKITMDLLKRRLRNVYGIPDEYMQMVPVAQAQKAVDGTTAEAVFRIANNPCNVKLKQDTLRHYECTFVVPDTPAFRAKVEGFIAIYGELDTQVGPSDGEEFTLGIYLIEHHVVTVIEQMYADSSWEVRLQWAQRKQATEEPSKEP